MNKSKDTSEFEKLDEWTRTFARRHTRTDWLGMQYDDLYQECFLIFVKLKGKYPPLTPGQFVRVYTSSCMNFVRDQARRRNTRKVESMPYGAASSDATSTESALKDLLSWFDAKSSKRRRALITVSEMGDQIRAKLNGETKRIHWTLKHTIAEQFGEKNLVEHLLGDAFVR